MKEFKKEVEDYLMNKWYISTNDITTDEAIEEAFNDGESVEDFSDDLAKKYDLILFEG